MKVIFLDCDGVLNSKKFFSSDEFKQKMSDGSLSFGSSQLDPSSVSVIDMIVDTTGAKIVISSAWRHIWDSHEIAKMFAEKGFKNADSIIDSTEPAGGNRGEEINQWLDLDSERKHVDDDHDPVTSWVIIDDVDEFSSDQRARFVQTNADVGITMSDARKAISILNKI